MRQTVLGLSLVLLSAGMGSCGLIGGDEPDVVEQSSETPSAQSFPSASPEVPSSPAAKVALTRPTDPNERLRVVKSGRTDPFAAIVPAVSLDNSSPPNSAPSGSDNQEGPTPSNSGTQSPTATVKVPKPGSSTPPSASKPGTLSPKPGTLSPKPGTPAGKIVLPTLPKPEVAQGVKVTGVVNLGNRPQAIIKAPGEKTTRTVGVGERIANGQVLIKAINLSNPGAPVVVLEQSGMEVRVGVGQEPVALAAAPDKSKK